MHFAPAPQLQFCQAPPAVAAALPQQDDLLLFVYWADVAAHKPSAVFARRRSTALPPDLQVGQGSLAKEVDWQASTLLNLVLQTQYHMMVVRASPADLDAVIDSSGSSDLDPGRTSPPRQGALEDKEDLGSGISRPSSGGSRQRMHSVTKVVHASPSRTPVNLDQSKSEESEPELAYPDICFAVDDFAEAFDSLVLQDPTDCYCVALYAQVHQSWGRALALQAVSAPEGQVPATAGADQVAAELERLGIGSGSTENEGSRLPQKTDSALAVPQLTGQQSSSRDNGQAHRVCLFSGYVSCRQLASALGGRLNNNSPLKALSGDTSRTTKVLLRGPGGVGRADVAVSADCEDGNSSSGSGPPPLTNVLRAAAAAAKGVVGTVKAVARGDGSGDGAVRLRCALMSLAVPVEALAEDILKAL